MRTITATELQRHARDVVDRVRMNREPIVVENRGKPMVAVLPYDDYEGYQRYRAQREERFRRLFAAADANAARNGLTDEEAMALADEALREYREERRRANG